VTEGGRDGRKPNAVVVLPQISQKCASDPLDDLPERSPRQLNGRHKAARASNTPSCRAGLRKSNICSSILATAPATQRVATAQPCVSLKENIIRGGINFKFW
jgi:hypothetical protein